MDSGKVSWLRALPLVLLALLGASCANEETADRVAADRAALRAADTAYFADRLRARYAAQRACLDLWFPALVHPDTGARAGPVEEQVVSRRYELLRAARLVRREEVGPDDPNWHGGPFVLRYTLTPAALPDAVPDTSGGGPVRQRLCYARARLVSVDSLVKEAPSPSWSAGDGVRYSDAVVYALHTVVFDSVAAWVPDLARRDSLETFGELQPRLVDGPQQRWAQFRRRNGEWWSFGTSTIGPP